MAAKKYLHIVCITFREMGEKHVYRIESDNLILSYHKELMSRLSHDNVLSAEEQEMIQHHAFLIESDIVFTN